MPLSAETPTLDAPDAEALTGPFIRTLVMAIRAHDTYGHWEKMPDAALLADFVIDAEKRRKIPIIANPDRKVLWRVDVFYAAVCLAIERETGLIAVPIMKLSHEGYGRVVLICGRLVAVTRNLRDVHRFGFSSLADLAAEGEKLTAEGTAMIRAHPAVAEV
ncbi:MAG TPA: NifX-associated nitrogen fixation protein [Rhodospirillales bacterium]|nr:NifX-associated nitrogen fixation protein [Rhodospirillales bacterium]